MKWFAATKSRMVLWIWQHTMTCQELARLASHAQDRSLTLNERLRIRLHTLICAWCGRYLKQIQYIHRAAPHLAEQTIHTPNSSLSTDAKQRIKEALQRQGQ